MTRLFHVSEEPNIKLFDPRPPPSRNAGVSGDAVWAIDHDHLAHYLLPRNCPRVTLRRGPATTPEDCARFFSGGIERIIAIEMAWYDRVKSAVLHVYEFPLENFKIVDSIAGYYISRNPVVPVAVDRVENPIEKIVQQGYKLRLLTDLKSFCDSVVSSTVQFSCIRMRHAASPSF